MNSLKVDTQRNQQTAALTSAAEHGTTKPGNGTNSKMMNKMNEKLKQTSLALMVTTALVSGASAQTLSQSPLEASIVAEPNIMLNLDDSLSMNNIVPEIGYDRASTYGDWVFDLAGINNNFIPNNIPYDQIGQGGCAANYIEGTLNASTRCMRLPDTIVGAGIRGSLYTQHYMQYLFDQYSSSGGSVDISTTLPGQSRLQVLQGAANQLIDSREGIRWCISDLFNNTGDPFVTAVCGAVKADLTAGINATSPPDGGGTPLSESYYKITEYFRGINGNTSPIQYRCQKNFAVMITDGYPTSDIGVVGDITNESKGDFNLPGSETLPNWDGVAPTTTVTDFTSNTVPRYSDGFFADPNLPAGITQSFEGYTLYLDDLALFGNEIDMFRTGLDNAGEPYGDATDPNATGDFLHQSLNTYTIGFGIENQMLIDAAEYGQGVNFSATNALELRNALAAILADVVGLVGSSAASTATTAFLSSGNQVFQVKYDTNDWSGTLLSYTIDSDPTSPTFGELGSPIWNTDDNFALLANDVVPSRNLLTYDAVGDTPIELTWGNLPAAQRSFFDGDEALFDYVLGDPSESITSGGDRRARAKLLGDVVHSQPVYVADQDYGYNIPSYATYLESTLVQNRDPVVYIGSNDGFMHGFSAPATSSGGQEIFGFLPSGSFPLVDRLDDRNYIHHYSVDGRSIAIDAEFRGNSNDEWGTVLISSMGAGGRGIFALDVTDPSKFSDITNNADDIYLWEIAGGYSNVALSATASQSGTTYGGVANRAIDGNTNGVYSDGSVSHTNNASQSWLELELDSPTVITEIELHNRTDCCSNRLSNFSVFVSPNPFTSTSLTATQAQPGVTEFSYGTVATELSIDVPNLVGQYIRVQLQGTNILSLAEIEVNGHPVDADFADLGHTVERPSVIRVGDANGAEWLVATGNGVHNPTGNAVFYLIDLADGTRDHAVVLDDSGDNAIVGHTAIDLDGNDFVDRIYLSDIKGSIWRLDWNSSNAEFESFFVDGSGDPVPLFRGSETTSGDTQPMTAAIEVTRFPGNAGALMLHFGTGKYYDIEDATLVPNELDRSFYGVIDVGNPGGGAYTPLAKSDLEEQTITTATIGSNTVRAVSSNPVNYALKSGWFIDLPTEGERVIYEAIAIKDRILFTTIIPRTAGLVDPCVPSVTGWLMEVDAISGGSPETVAFDANDDGDFDDADTILVNGVATPAAGIKPGGTSGAPLPPSIIRVEPGAGPSGQFGDGASGTLKGIVSDSQAQLREFIHETPIRRTSWRRLN